jgi:phage gpG-like protein
VKIRTKGDFSALKKFEKKLTQAPKVLDLVNRNMGEAAVDLVKEGFDKATDPYGKKWARLAIRQGEPLQDTGRLKNSWHSTFSRRGFRVAPGVTYAAFHQEGTGLFGPKHRRITAKTANALRLGNTGFFARSVKGAPQRKMVPDTGTLPLRWNAALNAAALEVLEDHFS